jgi:glycosyltransferase involved in cell wall biosynthesis
MPGDTAVIIPARNESDRVRATVTAALGLTGVDLVVVVDDGSRDATGIIAAEAGARVVRHRRGRGKGAAMESGAQAVARIEAVEPDRVARFLLFLDADLGASAAEADQLAEPVRTGAADATIAVFADRVREGGFGFVTGAAGAGIERATGWRPAQPLNGQRCLTRAAFAAVRPLARGWGAETGMTIDLMRQGLRIAEVEVPMSHRATGNDLRSHLHRLAQLRDVLRALAVRAWRRPPAGPSPAVR